MISWYYLTISADVKIAHRLFFTPVLKPSSHLDNHVVVLKFSKMFFYRASFSCNVDWNIDAFASWFFVFRSTFRNNLRNILLVENERIEGVPFEPYCSHFCKWLSSYTDDISPKQSSFKTRSLPYVNLHNCCVSHHLSTFQLTNVHSLCNVNLFYKTSSWFVNAVDTIGELPWWRWRCQCGSFIWKCPFYIKIKRSRLLLFC